MLDAYIVDKLQKEKAARLRRAALTRPRQQIRRESPLQKIAPHHGDHSDRYDSHPSEKPHAESGIVVVDFTI